MQLRRKIKQLLSITLCLMMLAQYIPAPARAAETKTVFLNPGGSSLWDQSGAWFAAWTWGGSSADAWVRFEETEEAGLYRAAMPADRTNMKLVRMSSAGQDFTWDRVSGDNPGIWNETGDLSLSGMNNLYTVTGWGASDGAWSHRHIPGTPATCQRGPVCDLCGTEYGEPTGDHTFDETGKCTVCGAACTHSSFADGKCTVCGADCTHSSFADGKCDDCGITGGYCGDVIWTYDEVTKAFAITGTGAMEDYNTYSDRPWDGSISENATSVTISEGVTRIGEMAFHSFTQITAVTVPASVESIGYCAFTSCEAMQSITFAEGSRLTAFDKYVFQNCTALKQITLPAGVTSVDSTVFSDCYALTGIFVEEGSTTLKDIDGVLYTADGTTLLLYPFGKKDTAFTTPAGVTTIGESVFEGNVNLKTITLSEGVTTIGMWAFGQMESLTTVTIPSSVTSIGPVAFEACDNLTTINAPCNWDTENPLYTFDSTVAVIVGDHTPNADGYTVNEDGTHSFTCSVCRMDAAESHSTEKEENKATCQRGPVCDLCGETYGDPDSTAHTPDEALGQTCMGYRCTRCESWFGVGNGDNHLKIGQCDCGLTAYPIWVMGIQVTNDNKDDVIPTISGMGGGAYGVRYDPEENILYAATKFGDPDADNVALKVIGDITLCAQGATIFGNVDVTGALTVTGEGTVTVNGYRYGIRAASIALGDGVYVLAKGDRAVESAAVTGQGYSRTAAERDYAPFTAPGTETYFEYVGRKWAQVAVAVDGKTQYYQSLDAAIRAVKNCAASDNAVVTLLTDLDLGGNHQEITSGVFTIDLNGKTLTSSDAGYSVLHLEGGNVTITDSDGAGTISGHYGVYANGCTVNITGGTIIAEEHAVESIDSTVNISGVKITGNVADLRVGSGAAVTLGLGAAFPGGLLVEGATLNAILAEGAAYWQGDRMTVLTESQTKITGGDVTVKAECKHENLSGFAPTADGTQHIATCSCGYEMYEAHSTGKAGDKAATCKDKAYCSVCQSEYGKTVDHSMDSTTGRCRFGCGEELAVISVAFRDTVAYFETAAEAFAYATDYGDWRTVTLLADVTENIYPMITGYVELDTNGYTLTVSQMSVGSGNSAAWLYIDDTADVPGTLVLQSANGGIHINKGTVRLLTGNVRATGGTGVIVNSGLFHMYVGSTLEARHHGILINDSQGSLQVEGGTVQAGADTDGQAYFAVYHRSGVGSSVLSGGIFLGGICRREEGSAAERSLRDMLADHYAFYAYDPQSGMGEMLAQPELKYCLDEDLAVDCSHDLDHVNNRKATCTQRAYCGKCLQFYGGTDPDNHDLILNTDGTDTVTQTCRNGCDYSRSIRLTVPQGAVYDGAEKAAAWEGDTLLGYTPEITYFLSGEEIHGTPTEPGSYTAKLTVGDVYVTADFAIDRITVTPDVYDAIHFERQYDGTVQAPGNALPVSYRGNINPNHSVAFRCSFAFTSPDADTREMVASFSITGHDAKYYKLSEETLSGDWGWITPKPLRVDLGEYTVVYGEEAPEFQPTYTGFVTGEDPSVLPEEVIILCEYDPTDPAKRNVGTYPIRPGNNRNGNYTLTAGQGQLTVVPAQVTVKIHDQTVTYGERAPEFTFECQGLRYDDLPEDLSPEFTLQCDYDPNIADAVPGSSYPITLASGGESIDNYTLTSLPGRLTVEKRPVTVTLSGSLSKDYDGTDSTGAASGELMPVAEGILSRDTVSAVIGSSRFASPDASQAPVTVIAEDIRLEGEDAANYFLTATTAQTHTGAIRPLDISGLDITPAPQLYWTGAEQTQQILVPNIGSLEPTYEVTGNRATHVGLYTLTVTGTGNFTGSREAEYAVDVDVSKLDFGGKNPSAQHLDTVNAILEALDSRDPDGDQGSYGEIWDTLEDNCVFWKTGIEDAQRALNSQAIRDTEACTDQNVQKEDRDSLEQALADLTDARENHSDFLSEEEAAAADESIKRVEGALAALERVENAEAAAQALPDIITSAAADKAVEAADAWDSLSDHEKSLLKPVTAEKLQTAGKVTQELNANVIRIYGDTRIETSLAAALELKALKDGKAFTDIVIARGDDFADALSAGYLAGQKDAPILLVTEGTMDTVKNFIRENAAPGANLYILGGTAAISDSILTGLSGYSLKRLAGANRYETNLLVLAEAGAAGKCMVLCSGTGYADALSAAALGCPIMLVGKKLLPQQEEFLADSSRNVFIIGGEKAVNGTVEQAVAALGCQVERIGGANRYETSLLVAQKATPNAQNVVLVSGRKYPDALCAGPLAQRLAAPILLVDEGAEQYAGSFIRAGSIRTAYVLGGYQALPASCSEGLLER